MRLLYITNGINGSGGLERVLATKTNYFIEQFQYEVHILGLNGSTKDLFFKFNPVIKHYEIELGGNPVRYLLKYHKGIKQVIQQVKPDIILVCDDGLKGLCFPLLFGKKTPVIYERHVSKQVEVGSDKLSLLTSTFVKLKFLAMDFLADRFDKFVVLTNGNRKEWKTQNLIVIPNPMPLMPSKKSTLTNPKAIAVGKQSYQKGYDRLLNIWQYVHKKHPDWKLEVYGKIEPSMQLEQQAAALGLSNSVHFFPPTKHIEEKYQEASIYLMSSRYEGFGMVLIEAMAYGVPCVSFDCPYGPSDIIKHNKDGIIVPNGDKQRFAAAVCELIENAERRNTMGHAAAKNVQRYSIDNVGDKWVNLFIGIFQ